MSNTGYIRATRFALKSINDGVETTTNFNIGDSFGNYLSVTTDTLLSMPVVDYENRINAFLLYVKGIYSGFTETTGVTNTSRFQSTNCSVEEPVLPPCYEYKLTCSGSIAEYFVIDCFGNGRYEKLDENEIIYICCTSVELTSGSGIFEINGACLTPTPTPTITEESKLGVYDGMKNAYMYDGSNFNIDINLPIFLINESNPQLTINSISLTGNFTYDLTPPISLSGFNESVLMNITYTGDIYSGETSTMTITTNDQILTYYIIREGHPLPVDIGVINARNSITNELVPNQTIVNDRTVVFKISSVSGTSVLGDVVITDPDFSSSGITSGLAINDGGYVNLTVTYNGSGSTDQTSIIINRLDGGNTLFFDLLYDESAVVLTTGEYSGFSCEKVDDTQPPVQAFKVLVNSGSTENNYQTFYTNETPTITAETPPEGLEFYIWIGDTQYLTSPTSPTTQITGVTSGSTVSLTAVYGVIRDVISTSYVHGGTITGGGKYQVGEIATLVATPDSNHYFSNWIGDVSYITSGSTTGNTIQITMPDHPITLSVVFSDYLVLTVNNGVIDAELTPQVGERYLGGIISHIFTNGEKGYVAGETHGIIFSEADLSAGAEWGCQGTNIIENQSYPYNGYTIGYGQINTNRILNACGTSGIAADLCNSYSVSGFTDWFLPSSGELQTGVNALPSLFVPNQYYWSSSQAGSALYGLVMSTTTMTYTTKSSLLRVKAAKYF